MLGTPVCFTNFLKNRITQFKKLNSITGLEKNNGSPLPLPVAPVPFSCSLEVATFILFCFFPGLEYGLFPYSLVTRFYSYFLFSTFYTALSCNYGNRIYFTYGPLNLRPHSVYSCNLKNQRYLCKRYFDDVNIVHS